MFGGPSEGWHKLLNPPGAFWGLRVLSQAVEDSARLHQLCPCQKDASMLGNDELCHPHYPQGEQLHVCPMQFSFLQPLLSGGAPFPFGKAKLVFCLPWLLLSCAMPCGPTCFGGSPNTRCVPNTGWLQMNAFAKVDAMAQPGFVSGSKT